MQITLPFGTAPSGEEAHLYVLCNANGMRVVVSDLGANLISCRVPDGQGNFPDVALGHSGAAGYIDDDMFIGAIIGRNCNRTAGATFEVGDKTYKLAANEKDRNNHSGPHFWRDRLWKVASKQDSSITFELTSRKGDQGFPGSCQVYVTYALSDANELSVAYSVTPSEATIINMTCHAYWNLNGQASGSVLDHTLQICADSYLPLDDQIPTGEIAPVEGTPYDFRDPHAIGACIDELPAGYDNNWCLGNNGKMTKAATLVGDRTGITLEVSTDRPGLQVFTWDQFDVASGKDGLRYGPFAGVALETQAYPDAIHHKDWPQPVYTPKRPFESKTVFAFGLREG